MKTELIGTIARAPKALGQLPNYFAAWQNCGVHKWKNNSQNYAALLKAREEETKSLASDISTFWPLIDGWPGIALEKIAKGGKYAKDVLKTISFMNDLGPHKGWLFAVEKGDCLRRRSR